VSCVFSTPFIEDIAKILKEPITEVAFILGDEAF
jgi:hypothetical protein